MALKPFTFSKDWTKPEDFPVSVSQTNQARKNIQLLHNETRDYINKVLAPSVVKLPESGAGTLGQFARSDGKGGIMWETLAAWDGGDF